MQTSELKQTLEESIRRVEQLPSHSPDTIESTARRLEETGYAPILLLPVDGFFRLTKGGLIAELKRTAELEDQEMRRFGFADGTDFDTKREQQIRLLVSHFTLLSRLRNDQPEAWDEVTELYEED
ncbi:MAG: hypothetical protein ACLFUM_06300 [Spirochaetaceae bacterium]